MSALILHGIVKSDSPTPEVSKAHQRIIVGDLVAIVTNTDLDLSTLDSSPEVILQTAVQHHLILSDYAPTITILPVRVGTAFSDVALLKSAIVDASNSIAADLEQLYDQGEYVLSVRSEAKTKQQYVTCESGRSYLKARQSAHNQRRTLASRQQKFMHNLGQAFQGISVQVFSMESSAANALCSIALIVPKELTTAMTECCQELSVQATELQLRLTLTGPGPCYSHQSDRISLHGESHVQNQ